MSIPEVLLSALIAIAVLLFLVSIPFFMYKASLDDNAVQKSCIENGGSWVISERTQGIHPDYECQMN